MPLVLSRGTQEDIPRIIEIKFQRPGAVPNTPAGRQWYAKSVLKGILEREQNTFHMLVSEQPENGIGGKILSFSRWIVQPGGGPVPAWNERWVAEMGEGMSEEAIGKRFFEPMARQHALVTGDRPHYCTSSLLLPLALSLLT